MVSISLILLLLCLRNLQHSLAPLDVFEARILKCTFQSNFVNDSSDTFLWFWMVYFHVLSIHVLSTISVKLHIHLFILIFPSLLLTFSLSLYITLSHFVYLLTLNLSLKLEFFICPLPSPLFLHNTQKKLALISQLKMT